MVGDLKKIEIGHDDTGVGSAWLLSHVVVRVKDGSDRSWFFNSNQWYSTA